MRNIKAYGHRQAFGRTASRLASIVRNEETLNVEITSGTWVLQRVGFEVPLVIDGSATAPIAIDVDEGSLHLFDSRLHWAIDHLRLAYRKSISNVEVSSLRLHRRKDISQILPGLSFHIAGAALRRHQIPRAVHASSSSSSSSSNFNSLLGDLTLTQCTLPTNLARMLPHVRRLRIWDCFIQTTAGQPVHRDRLEFAKGLMALPQLDALIWAGESRPPPTELLDASRAATASSDTPLANLKTLVLGIDRLDFEHREEGLPLELGGGGGHGQ